MSKQMTGATPVGSFLSLVVSVLVLAGCMGESTPYTPVDGSSPNNAAPTVSTEGYWDAPFTVATQKADSGSSPAIINQDLSIADNGNAFLSYALTSSSGSEELKVLRAVAPEYSWSSASDPMMTPVDIKLSPATATQFAVNPTNSDGYALWSNGTGLQISEFMNGMGHFMTRADVGEGHVPQLRVNQEGAAYLVSQDHLTNGFAINVTRRLSVGSWSSHVSLERRDAASEILLPNHLLLGSVDGQGDILAVWLEQQSGVYRLMTATYDTESDTWGGASTIVDSDNTVGLDLAATKSIGVADEPGTNKAHVAVFTDDGSAKSIFMVNYDGAAWQMPMRADAQTATSTISGRVRYAFADGRMLLAWVETSGTMQMIKALRFDAGAGWSSVADVAMAAMGATIDDLALAINSHGHAIATWLETSGTETTIQASLQQTGGSWAAKEHVLDVAAGDMMTTPAVAMHSDGTPWMVVATGRDDGTNVEFTTALIRRAANITDVGGAAPDTGAGDGHNHDHGGDMPAPDTGTGTTDPGAGSGTTDPGTGGTTTDPGAGAGTTDPGTGTTDPGTGSGGGMADPGMGTTDPGTGAATGLWGSQTVISATDHPVADEAVTRAPVIREANNGNVFLSWLTQSGHSQDPAHVEQDMTIVRGMPASSGGYTWSDAASAMMKPTGFDAHAMEPKFVVNPVTGDGFANWRDGTTTYISEFMGMMGHFMTNVQFAASDASQVLIDATGKVYLLTKAPMMGGFGLSVYTRSGFDSWSTAVQLHRMDMANAFSMPNNFMVAAVDGLNNIRVVWLEDHAGAMSLQTATFNTSTSTWSTVAEVHAHGMTLNRVVSGIASGTPGTADLEVVLHEQDGMGMNRAIFAVSYDETGGWAEPARLDMASAEVTVVSAPSFARNSNGSLLVAWVETNAAMTANNSSGLMHMIMGKTYTPGSGWSSMVHIASAAMNADASAVAVAVGTGGDMSATWLENAGGSGQLFASHKIAANTIWSQKESVITLSNGDGVVQAHSVGLTNGNLPLVLLATRTTDGVNDAVRVGRVSRLSAIDNAAPGSGGMDPGNGGTTDPGTGGGTTDPGTGSGGGTGGDVDPGTPLPPSAVWTTPLMVSQMMHSAATTRFFGPEVVRDDVGGTAIKMSMEDINLGEGAAISAVHNNIVRSADGSEWGGIVMNSALLAGLTSSAVIHTIDVVASTGNLYGLIRDGDKLYLARYLVNVGWSKIEVPGVHSSIVYSGLQLASNQSGMVTLSWNELADQCCDVHIHAKHYMASGGWQETETLTVPAEAILDSHVVENDGTVHAAWLVTNPDAAVGGYNLKMAVYTPMQGWSAQIDGPTGLVNSLAVTGGSGNQQVVAIADPASGRIDAYMINADGTWSKHGNINQKSAGDGVQLVNARDTEVIAGGDASFMVVWREHVTASDSLRYRSASVGKMTNPSTGMEMWHWTAPSAVAGAGTEAHRNMHLAMDSMGNAYAAWTSVDTATDHSHVYVNRAPMMGGWGTPEMLAEYDLATGASARNTSIAINALNQVSIVWDQHMVSSTSSMHHVWVVEKQ